MIPLRDDVRLPGVPFATAALITVNIAVFIYEYFLLPLNAAPAFADVFGLEPRALVQALLRGSVNGADYQPVVTSLFLHGGLMHLIGNMWYLWLFGHSSEICLGRLRFLGFYFACGIAANLAHVAFYADSAIPIIGASGAVSGVLGAYLYCFPRAKILTLVPLFIIFTTIEVPATAFIGFWFFLQLINGTASIGAQAMIAWWAHIGGFLAGMALVRLFRRA